MGTVDYILLTLSLSLRGLLILYLPNGGGRAAGGAAPAPAVGDVIAIADPPNDITAPRDTLAHQRAQAARMATQYQMAAVAAVAVGVIAAKLGELERLSWC
jgi:hypothetical protein